jgi:hypothetical protein
MRIASDQPFKFTAQESAHRNDELSRAQSRLLNHSRDESDRRLDCVRSDLVHDDNEPHLAGKPASKI